MELRFFDPQAPYDVSPGTSMPHWDQPGCVTFITFRTEDSLPASAKQMLERSRCEWLRRRGLDGIGRGGLTLPAELQQAYVRVFWRRTAWMLNRSYGRCPLRDPRAARIVADSLLHFDGRRYDMHRFVVMPNHVHLLATLHEGVRVQAQCNSWKHFSAREINRLLGTSGRLWQEESFDHLVRSERQMERLGRYLRENPWKAGLREGEFLYWVRG